MEWDSLFVSSGGAARAWLCSGSPHFTSGQGVETGLRDGAHAAAWVARASAQKK